MPFMKENLSKTLNKPVMISLVLVIVGVITLLYPVAAAYMHNASHAREAQKYIDVQKGVSDADRERWIAQAQSYNERLARIPILDPWLSRVSKDSGLYREYMAQLNAPGTDDAVMSVVSIPSITTTLPVFHGTDDEALDKGLGHIYGSSLPVGGENTHAVITGHSGLAEATMFDNLEKVQVGDMIYVDTVGKVLTYKVTDTEVVLPSEIESLRAQKGKDLLTLITCTPYAINTHRLLVHAERVETSEQNLPQSAVRWEGWMAWRILAALAIVAVVLVIYLRRRAGNKENERV
ncbi:class C sortase [Corynebacterium pseudotuberculosis]|uniref:Class C sortase n=1 Tax=Corynebacterium pseudotuberculosis 258 TaxID=1168865 RepID=A0AAU8PTE4_CORPS|nr:class C sortase [Corynebacterium pseudotuberculosis]AER69896.1 Fimbrial associated sortase-like protein [Corynebacterium pseudotuberculosis 1/06-A]AFB73238.1 class C sortase [Corynebacterium pseudotuberculosis 316]AFH91691.1 class C sortase [Corynebacterium pseudotuberculosis 31]AFK17535.1 class C sortase [Corynebacterium pseudotuberculosis 258]AKS14247.1 Fimbrial associated sortase-like protein [Corynebacterium pseudotuberculosis]